MAARNQKLLAHMNRWLLKVAGAGCGRVWKYTSYKGIIEEVRNASFAMEERAELGGESKLDKQC